MKANGVVVVGVEEMVVQGEDNLWRNTHPVCKGYGEGEGEEMVEEGGEASSAGGHVAGALFST